MRHKSTKHQKKHINFRAQALVEFALLLPLLLVLILGAMDLGRVFYVKTVLTNAAREGANTLSRYPADYTKTWEAISTEGDSSGVTITAGEVSYTGCCTVNSPVTVTLEKDVDLVFDGFLNAVGIIDGPVTISSSVTMAVLP